MTEEEDVEHQPRCQNCFNFLSFCTCFNDDAEFLAKMRQLGTEMDSHGKGQRVLIGFADGTLYEIKLGCRCDVCDEAIERLTSARGPAS